MAIKLPITLKSVGIKLAPFLTTVAAHFVLFGDQERPDPSILYCIVKCLPIISLKLFILLHGINFTDACAYPRRITFGLTFGVIGDAFIVWKDTYFIHGMTSFAMCHVLYIIAFGFQPFKMNIGAVLACICVITYKLFLAPGLDGLMSVAIPMYLILILTMAWRAVARVQLFDELWTWPKLLGCAGALCFLVSDFILAINEFRFEVPYAQQMIMITYYAAQFGITLSVIDTYK